VVFVLSDVTVREVSLAAFGFPTTVLKALVFLLIWVLKETIKQKLLVFEMKILRRIFGPTKERDGTWRIKTNDEQTDRKQNYNKLY
jgi:hypothetical protein